MEEQLKYAKYEAGICRHTHKDIITKDGHTMFVQDTVKDLNRKSYLEEQLEVYKEVVEAVKVHFETSTSQSIGYHRKFVKDELNKINV
jgi:hypothetical protein